MDSVNDREAPAERCSTLCGMCPSCVFGPEPPGSDRCLWTVNNDLRRKFIVGLILRCTSAKVLQTIQEALRFTSWTLFNHVRSEIPSCTEIRLARTGTRASDGEPLGLDVNKIFDWFTGSSDMTKSRFILRLFSLCDSELLRMAANLTNVLLARQQQGLTQIDGKEEKQQKPFLCASFWMLQFPSLTDRCRQSSTRCSPRQKTITLLQETSILIAIFTC